MKKTDKVPPVLERFSGYQIIVLNRSKLTAKEYRNDIMLFLRFIMAKRNNMPTEGEDFDNINVSEIDDEFFRKITSADIMEFLMYTAQSRANSAKARARKLTSIRIFFKYLISQLHILEDNPATNIDSPRIRPALPKFLNESECLVLLDTILSDTDSKTRIRDFAIVVLFLNCGMRLSELVGINLSDIDSELRSLRVTGKGAKMRVIYLNESCRSAILNYLSERNKDAEIKDKNALFISSHHRRISNQMVQKIVYKYLDMAGFGNRGLSVHKLRHTAATLMYRTGKVDVRVLKDILGHEQLTTTQIYTHVSDESMEKAMSQNPLSNITIKKPCKEYND